MSPQSSPDGCSESLLVPDQFRWVARPPNQIVRFVFPEGHSTRDGRVQHGELLKSSHKDLTPLVMSVSKDSRRRSYTYALIRPDPRRTPTYLLSLATWHFSSFFLFVQSPLCLPQCHPSFCLSLRLFLSVPLSPSYSFVTHRSFFLESKLFHFLPLVSLFSLPIFRRLEMCLRFADEFCYPLVSEARPLCIIFVIYLGLCPREGPHFLPTDVPSPTTGSGRPSRVGRRSTRPEAKERKRRETDSTCSSRGHFTSPDRVLGFARV